ncbi:MAG: hypothetical protein DDT18_00727 [Actinobacteria bacterium]|nr:hypothetical protein [Actinomycetota bacterium]
MSEERQKEFVSDWEARIDSGLKYRKKYSSEDYWKKYREYYRGRWGNDKIIPLNRIFSFGRALLPRVYFRTPTIMVTPRRPGLEAQARILESIDNWIIREIKLKYTMKKAALDSYISGVGPIKLGYDSEFGYLPDLAVGVDGETGTSIGRASATAIEYNVNIKPGMPWAMRVKPESIITPWGYDDPDMMPWIANIIYRPLEDVHEDQKYNVNRFKLVGGYNHQLKFKNPHFASAINNEQKYCELTEIRCAKTKSIIVISEGNILMDERDELQIEGLPYEFVIFNEDIEHFWGISDVFLNWPQQKELIECRTQASLLRKLAILKLGYKKGALKREDIEKFLSSAIEDIGAGLEIDDDAINSALMSFQPRNTVDDTTKESREVEADMRETFGFSRNQLGEFSPFHGKTAAETRVVEAGAEIRNDERRDIIADTLVNIIRKINQYIFKFWTEERVIQVTGPDGAAAWVRYTGDQLTGEYDHIIDPDSGQPISKAIKYQAVQQLLETFRDDPYIDPIKLRKMLLRQFEWLDPVASELVREPGHAVPGGYGSPETPIPFEQFARQLRGGVGASP